MQRLSDLTHSVSTLPRGTGFFRYCRHVALTRGGYGATVSDAYASTPLVGAVLRSGLYGMGAEIRWKAAVAAGSTSDSASDAPLVQYTNLVSEFVELLRPATILGRLTGARHVPMNVRFPRETGGVSAGWVAEGAATPASAMAFDSVTLGFAKIAGIVVLTKELAEFSGPAADSLLGAELLHATAAFMDSAFIDPGRAAVADTSPASITNGITPVQSSGSTATEIANDLAEMVGTMGDAGVPMTAPVWIMRPSDAAKLAGKVGSSGNSAFPEFASTAGCCRAFRCSRVPAFQRVSAAAALSCCSTRHRSTSRTMGRCWSIRAARQRCRWIRNRAIRPRRRFRSGNPGLLRGE